MATTTKVIAIGNSVGIILPKEALARLNVEKGDTLYIAESSRASRSAPTTKSSGQRWRLRIRSSAATAMPSKNWPSK